MSDEVEKITERLKRRPKSRKSGPAENGLSSGSTLLNLACTDDPDHAYEPGQYVFFVGDSTSGKTVFTLAALAEASINPDYDNYRLIYIDREGGALMDMEAMYGRKMAARIESVTDVETVEQFYQRLDSWSDPKRPFVCILDSMDALRSAEDDRLFDEHNKAIAAGKEPTKGSYGTAKAKANSNNLPRVLADLSRTGSILFIISQTRDNIGFGSQFNPKTRSGGNALKFYATLEMWTSVSETIKKRVLDKDRPIGIRSKVQIKKNRHTGRKHPDIEVPILHGCGMDDLGGLVQWLLDEGHWAEAKKANQKVIEAPEFGFEGKLDSLVAKVESEGRQDELRSLAANHWRKIEEGCRTSRRSRYE